MKKQVIPYAGLQFVNEIAGKTNLSGNVP